MSYAKPETVQLIKQVLTCKFEFSNIVNYENYDKHVKIMIFKTNYDRKFRFMKTMKIMTSA